MLLVIPTMLAPQAISIICSISEYHKKEQKFEMIGEITSDPQLIPNPV